MKVKYEKELKDNDAIFDILADPDAKAIIEEGVAGQIKDLYPDTVVEVTLDALEH